MAEITIALSDDQLEAIAQRVAEIIAAETACARSGAGDSRWLSIPEAADYLRCSKQRVYDLRSSGRLSRHGEGRRALVDRRELEGVIRDAR